MLQKKITGIAIVLLLSYGADAQLYNNGATIKIQNGAYLYSKGDVFNNTGTITNDGKLEVQGNFTNTGTYNSTTTEDSIIMSGAGNVTLQAGGATINYLMLNKNSNSDEVKLTQSANVGKVLDYLVGNFTTDPINNPAYFLSAPNTAVFNFGANNEIIGKVKRTGWVSNSSVVFNQPNMRVNTTGGTAPSEMTVTMIPQSAGGDPSQNEREVKRNFAFSQTGGTGFTASVRFAYSDAELNTNTEEGLVPWQLVSSEWNGELTPVTRDASSNYVEYAGITAAELTNEWKLADAKYTFNAKAYLRGAWNNATGLMRTNLNSGNLLPLSQPYAGPPTNYPGTESVASIPNANIVDWVLLEFRKPGSGDGADADALSTIGRKAAFLLNNGDIVDLDGVSSPLIEISKQGGGFLVVKHRNHIAIMSNNLASNAQGTFTNDFSIAANAYTNPLASSSPTTILFTSAPGNTLYGMWPGDVNRNGTVSSSDLTPIYSVVGSTPDQNTNLYSVRDVNLDKNITNADASNASYSISNFANASVSKPGFINTVNLPHILKSHVPGESN